MLSTILIPPPAPAGRSAAAAPLARTLAALVPATVEGVIRDVLLLSLPDDREVAALADEAGCRLVDGSDFGEALARAVAAARSMSLFVLRAGTVPSRLFGEEVARSLDGEAAASGALVLREEPMRGFARLLPGCLAPIAGVILPRARLAGTRCDRFSDVVRRARPAKPLPSRAVVRV